MKISLIVFDLDDTLLDTTGLLIPIARTPAFEARIRQPLPLMDGAQENLEILSRKYNLVILTQGRTDAQKQKVISLGIAPFFKAQYIADPANNETKGDWFKKILQEWKISADQMLSIGNRRTTDIREAKKQGAWTCLFRYGEHQSEKVAVPEDQPDFEVDNHHELIEKCRL